MDTVVLIGGGSEEAGGWSDPLFAAIGEGRSVAILGASESSEPGWYADYFLSLGAVRAEEFVIAGRAEALAAELEGFDAFFLRGGDQWDYVSAWADTPVETAILAATAVGGTSAGAAVLGELDFTAEIGTVYSEEVLADATNAYVTLSDTFLPLLPGVITDTHFTERGRIGRLAPFAACNGLVGVGVDDKTGVVVRDGTWTVEGTGTVTLVREAVEASCAGGPPRVEDARLDVLVAGMTWDGEDVGGAETARIAAWSAVDAEITRGTEGTWAIVHAAEDSLYCGSLELVPGDGALVGLAVSRAFDEDEGLDDARVGGTFYGLARLDLPVGVMLPTDGAVSSVAGGGFTASGSLSALVVLAEDGSTSEDVGWQDADCDAPRMARALTGARLSVVPPDGSVAFVGVGKREEETTGDDAGDPGGAPGEGCGCGGDGVGGAAVGAAILAALRRKVRLTRRPAV